MTTTPTSGAADRAIEGCPELNMGNYDEVDVERLNDWAIRANDEIDRLHALAAGQATAQPVAEPAKPDPAYSAACNLATALFKKHFAHLPDFASGQAVWSLCDSTAGVISQIDNMVAGLVQPPTSPKADSVQEDALSDSVRTPLDSLHADAAYLIGRLREGSMPYARVIEIIREHIDAAKAAIRASAAHGQAPATEDSVLEDAARLDFLIEQGAYVVSDPDTCTGHWLHWARPDGSTWVQGDEHQTPRAAIDAARKQGEKQ